MKEYLKLVKEDGKHALERFKEALFYANKAKNNNIFIRTILPANNLEQIFETIAKKKEGKELFGLLFSVKDVFSVSNQNVTLGLKEPVITRNNRHAALVQKFIELGASLYGITNLDPLEIDAKGENEFYGNVSNTVFKSKTAGGSSSGAGASVGGNIVDFAIGSDSGGSVRIPAACHGLVGLSGSEEVLPTKGMLKVSGEFSSAGLITKNLLDLELLLSNLNSSKNEIKNILIPNLSELSEEVDKNILKKFEDYLASVNVNKELSIKLEFKNLVNFRKKVISKEVSKLVKSFGIKYESLPKSAKALITLSEKIGDKEYSDILSEVNDYRKIHSELIESSTLILPCLPTSIPENNRGIPDNFNNLLCYSSVCKFPSLSFPIPASSKGEVPFSVQFVGSKNSDLGLVNLAISSLNKT